MDTKGSTSNFSCSGTQTYESGNVNNVGESEPPSSETNQCADFSVDLESNENYQGTCAICLDNYKNGEEITCSPNVECDHQFHRKCIAEWLLNHEECPFCRHIFLSSTDNEGLGEAKTCCMLDSDRGDVLARPFQDPPLYSTDNRTSLDISAQENEEESDDGLSC